MTKEVFLDELDGLRTVLDALPAEAKILSLSIGTCGTDLLIETGDRFWGAHGPVASETLSELGFLKRTVHIGGVRVNQIDELEDDTDWDEPDNPGKAENGGE